MRQIEFKTRIRENIIVLPDHLKSLNYKHVRVIISEDLADDASEKKLPPGFYHPLYTESYQVIGKREDIYER